MFAVALEVLHPLKLLSQNILTTFLAPPFVALVHCERGKTLNRDKKN